MVAGGAWSAGRMVMDPATYVGSERGSLESRIAVVYRHAPPARQRYVLGYWCSLLHRVT